MNERTTEKMLHSKAERVSEHVGTELRVEHSRNVGYRITNTNESLNLSEFHDARATWNWLDAFEKGFDYSNSRFVINEGAPELTGRCTAVDLETKERCINKPKHYGAMHTTMAGRKFARPKAL
jgi:hypothetical protein